ncbi:MAG: hypothetical protein ACK4WH_07740 [Phycisphaerales bacterium]
MFRGPVALGGGLFCRPRGGCWGGGFGSERPAAAQGSPFYGEVDETLRGELAQWSTHYWNRVDTGATAKVGEFAFSNPALNSPLFNPLRGVRPTLEQVKVLTSTDCDGLAALQPGWGDTTISDAFREAMKDWKISTDATTNATGTAVHLALITAAPPGAGTTWTTVGNLVISEKLPLAGVTGTNAEPTIAGTVSFETQEAINKLIVIGPIIAAASAGTTEAQALITGEESHAAKFERGVRTLLSDGGWEGTTIRIDAEFGCMGSLPLVLSAFSDVFVLIDTVTGNLAGPFAPGSVLDARDLLQAHGGAFLSGTTVRYTTPDGCPVAIAATTVPGPLPPSYVPSPPSPSATPPATLPGNPSPWNCVTRGAGPTLKCVCTLTESWVFFPPAPPAPPPAAPYGPPNNLRVRVKHTCEFVGGGCGTPTQFPAAPGVPSPGATPPVPGPTNGLPPVTPTCTMEHYTW